MSCPAYRFVLAVCSLMFVLLGCSDSSAPSTGIAGAPDAETFSETVTETAVVPEDQASGPSLEIGDSAPLLQIARLGQRRAGHGLPSRSGLCRRILGHLVPSLPSGHASS